MAVPGQLSRKNCASSHEVICEQWVLPSHWYFCAAAGAAADIAADGACETTRPLKKKWYPNMAAQMMRRITFFKMLPIMFLVSETQPFGRLPPPHKPQREFSSIIFDY